MRIEISKLQESWLITVIFNSDNINVTTCLLLNIYNIFKSSNSVILIQMRIVFLSN